MVILVSGKVFTHNCDTGKLSALIQCWNIVQLAFSIAKRKSIYVYTGCPRRNVPNFGRVFLMLNYTDVTRNTYIQSWTVTEIMAIEKCGLLWGSTYCTSSVTPYSSTAHARQWDITVHCSQRKVAVMSQDNISCSRREVLGNLRQYDSSARVCVVQFNGFMSLTSYFDVKYRY
jgi:hypothetical protein